jgi:hypothetical protein
MQSRAALVVLIIAVCASVALGALDVATEIVSPRVIEVPGLVPVSVKLTNLGDTAALVPRLDVKILPSGYEDYRTSIAVAVGHSQMVYLNPWVCPSGANETCTAWIIYPADSNHSNDADFLFVRTESWLDVAAEIVSPRAQEQPGLVPVQVRLTNVGGLPALVPRLDVTMRPSGYWDYRESIAVSFESVQVLTFNPWVYTGDNETCIAWITYPADTNRLNDADAEAVTASGISGRGAMESYTGLSLTLSPSPLAGNVLHVEYSLSQAGPASATVFDISGRPVATHRFAADRSGKFPLALHLLSAGVYLVRLEDGHQSVVRKLVVQR